MRQVSRIIGAIFCQVRIRRELNQFNPLITSGNQKWNGAAPIFNSKVVLIKIVLIGLNSSGKILELKKIITEKIKREDAII